MVSVPFYINGLCTLLHKWQTKNVLLKFLCISGKWDSCLYALHITFSFVLNCIYSSTLARSLFNSIWLQGSSLQILIKFYCSSVAKNDSTVTGEKKYKQISVACVGGRSVNIMQLSWLFLVLNCHWRVQEHVEMCCHSGYSLCDSIE